MQIARGSKLQTALFLLSVQDISRSVIQTANTEDLSKALNLFHKSSIFFMIITNSFQFSDEIKLPLWRQ